MPQSIAGTSPGDQIASRRPPARAWPARLDQPRRLPAEAEGSHRTKLRREAHRRMLGNGHCARPVELDCHFESICEACTFFVTTIEFRSTLQRQRDAAAKGQKEREQIFDDLINRIDESAS